MPLDHAVRLEVEFLKAGAAAEHLTPNAETFDRVDQSSPEIRDPYWSGVRTYFIPVADRLRAVRTLLETGHPNAALDLLSLEVPTNPDVDPDLIIRALDEATAEGIGNVSVFAYNVTKALEFLDSHPNVDRTSRARLEWRYLSILEHHVRPTLVLHEMLARDPRFFVEVIAAVFPSNRNDDDQPPTEEQSRLAVQAYQLLRSWRALPGMANPAHPSLEEWVRDARTELTRRGVLRGGDEFIGRSLGRASEDPDGTWPGELVREIIEDARSSDLESGIAMTVLEGDGPTWRSLDTGGQPERARANLYQTYAGRVSSDWPRTRRMLVRIAEDWDRRARQEDHLAEVREDFWS